MFQFDLHKAAIFGRIVLVDEFSGIAFVLAVGVPASPTLSIV
jgi:hypothetical protein